jgi:diguanylate cyclase (GGDEF)-like protein
LGCQLLATSTQAIINALTILSGALFSLVLFLLFYFFKKRHIYTKQIQTLVEKVFIDSLTQVYNRHFFDSYFNGQVMQVNSNCSCVSLIMIDIDNFKNLNDTHGHAAGDNALRLFAETIIKNVRKSDIVARYGGDEFIVILPSAETVTAVAIADRICRSVNEDLAVKLKSSGMFPISCSMGISTCPTLCSSDDLIKTADIALYKAKNAGKNCIMVYEKVIR